MSLAGADGTLTAGTLAALALAALLGLLGRRVPPMVPRALALAGSLGLFVLGVLALSGATPTLLEWWPGFPGQPFTLRADAVTGPFLLLLGLTAAGASLGIGGGTSTAAGFGLQTGFVFTMATVLLSRHALLFLLAWEGMTLVSALLVARDTTNERARRATTAYLTLSHAGTALLAWALLTLAARAGGFSFPALTAAWSAAPAETSAALAWAFTAGFAVKLGLVPLHVWLPLAHPEAPSSTSALMSGAMVKLGLYGLLRFVWDLPGAPPPHWGTALLLAGMATTLTGALFATVESDAKRLLAWSTVKHAGVLAIGLGLAAALHTAGRADLAGLALAGVLVHALGHGLAKSAAFLAVGEAVHAAGTRSLESLGGLARRMPGVATPALLATLSLAGLPLSSCFAGEWLLYQALLLGYSAGAGDLRLVAPFAGAALALSGALALAAMVKLHGIGFLGRPRSEGAAHAQDASPARAHALFAVALLPLGIGMGAPWVAASLTRAVSALLPGTDSTRLAGGAGFLLEPLGLAPTSVSPFAVALLLGGLALVVARLRRGRAGERIAPSWSGGTRATADQQYTALGFTQPLRLVFEPVLRPERGLEVLEGDSPWFARRLRHRAFVPPWFERVIYRPLLHALLWWSERARRLQAGSLHLYLAYLLLTLVALLVWAR